MSQVRMKPLYMKRLFLCLLPLAAGCSSVPQVTSYLTPYKIDVRQGNYVSQEMAAQLKPGQTKDQVRFILGTPLVADMFHADRWDYVYRFQPGHGEPQMRRMVVFFADGKLLRITCEVVAYEPGNGELQAPAATARTIEIGPEPGVVKDEKRKDGIAPATASGN
jgi:outer membrane protein assembly factor BamE